MSQHRLCNNFGSAKCAGPANIFCASHLKFSDAVLFTNATYLEPCPRLAPSAYNSNAGRFWTTAHMAFHGFGTATRMLSPTGTSNIVSEYTGGIQKHGALLPHSWIQEAPLKGLAGWRLWGLYRNS